MKINTEAEYQAKLAEAEQTGEQLDRLRYALNDAYNDLEFALRDGDLDAVESGANQVAMVADDITSTIEGIRC